MEKKSLKDPSNTMFKKFQTSRSIFTIFIIRSTLQIFSEVNYFYFVEILVFDLIYIKKIMKSFFTIFRDANEDKNFLSIDFQKRKNKNKIDPPY